MEQNIRISGKAAVVIGVIVIVGVVLRMITFSDSGDTTLEQAVRAELWSTYSGQIGTEVERIRTEGDYGSVSSLLEKASPDAIIIERISRSEPLFKWSSTQKVIVRVRYRFPDDTAMQTQYMKFDHGALSGWRYRFDATALSYYLNFF